MSSVYQTRIVTEFVVQEAQKKPKTMTSKWRNIPERKKIWPFVEPDVELFYECSLCEEQYYL